MFNVARAVVSQAIQSHNQKVVTATSNEPRSLMDIGQSIYNYNLPTVSSGGITYPDSSPAPLLQQQGQSPRGKKRASGRKQISSTSHSYSRRRKNEYKRRKYY